MSTRTVHFVVESGPDRGRELQIPAQGARLGRASGNDIMLNDPSVSRFQCRFYFKNERDLCVADLASTNETMVNGRPVQDIQLFVGDRVMVGESTLKVVCDTLGAATTEGAAPAPSATTAAKSAAVSPSSQTPAVAPVVTTAGPTPGAIEIDLGLQRNAAGAKLPSKKSSRPRSLWRRLAFPLLVAFLAVGGALFIKLVLLKPSQPAVRAGTGPETVSIRYEKVQAGTNNVFRYYLELSAGSLGVQVDNLADGRHVRKEKKVAPGVIKDLVEDLEQSGFFDLAPEHSGVPREDVWDQWDLEIGFGARVHRVRVRNRIEPREFEKARGFIEEFARAELGLYALALQPDELTRRASDAFLQGQKLYNEKEVRYENLALAIRSFAEVEALLETIEPKPEYYPQAISTREECKRLMQERYEEYSFNADRAMKLKDWKTAADNLQILLETLHDRSDERYEDVYKKLVTAQRYLKPR